MSQLFSDSAHSDMDHNLRSKFTRYMYSASDEGLKSYANNWTTYLRGYKRYRLTSSLEPTNDILFQSPLIGFLPSYLLRLGLSLGLDGSEKIVELSAQQAEQLSRRSNISRTPGSQPARLAVPW